MNVQSMVAALPETQFKRMAAMAWATSSLPAAGDLCSSDEQIEDHHGYERDRRA